MRIGEILGKGVLDKNANTIGKMADFELDVNSWTITHFIVKSGLLKKSTISVDNLDKIGDKILLKVSKEELEQ